MRELRNMTTLCYIEADGCGFFSLKLRYEGDSLAEWNTEFKTC